VTPRHSIADETSLVTRQGILRRLSREGIRIAHLSEPRWTNRMESGALEIEQVYTGERSVLEPLAFLAYSTPRLPDQRLLPALHAAGLETRLIGDCVMARNVMAATTEGHAVGHAV
jgi:dimethylglycine catabolism A